ncbi:uncharacterized protein BDV17DRAFT_265100 [Aspergillus undulatus]|uniref:uncharacterized protein n=1 Tax=Aspergillus undulatus TaxID=1810928 RepID=UPI003CCD9757
MAVRRSARLRSLQSPVEETPSEPKSQNNVNKNKRQKNLNTVMERDEPIDPPADAQSTPAKAQTPKAHTPKTQTPKAASSHKKSPAKTPTTSITRPTHFEMHPSKVHQSTTKQADSGLILGFNPIKKDAQGNVVKETPAQNTPSKTNASPASAFYGTPALDFKFSCQDSQLSDEAKKLMESVRDDVARIKADMIKDQATNNESSQNGQRKIAKPKGKAGRFSDVHMAEFKKMDSIAGHASAFRAAPGRSQPIDKTLKRTNSKARLDEADSHEFPASGTPKTSAPTTPSAKRVKQDKPNATPSSRPPGTKSALARPRSSIRSSLLTPTRSSMARASGSLKPPRTTMIPSLARSPLSKPADVPTTPRTEFNPRFKSNIPTLGSLKSILRRSQPLFSKDPAKIAAGTHRASPDFTPDLLLQPSHDDSQEPAVTPSPKKRVEFTPCTKPRAEEVISPSPSKIPTAAPYPSMSDVVYPTLPVLTPDRGGAQKQPTIRSVRPSEVSEEATLPSVPGVPHGLNHKKHAPPEPTLPEVPGMPHGISHKKRHRATADETDRENVPPADDPSQQERSAKRVKMNTPEKPKLPASSPLKSRSHTPSRLGSGIRKGTPGSARPRSRMLSMSRLNMLAQPKNRS